MADRTLYVLSRMGRFDGAPVPNAQFPIAYQQFQQSWTVGSGPLDNDLNAQVLSELLEKLDGGILVTHSMGGTIGWRTAILNDKIKAIVAFEPGDT